MSDDPLHGFNVEDTLSFQRPDLVAECEKDYRRGMQNAQELIRLYLRDRETNRV